MISILCSNYNSSEHIDRYLHYINSQFLKEFEVIFVDAASSDDSLQKISNFNFREGIKNRILSCDNRISIYEAWNLAIDNSCYDYVMNYNTDDKLFGNTLYTLAEYIKLYPHIDVIYSNCFISSDINHENIVNFYNWNDANDIQNLLRGCCCGPFPLLKKETVINCGMFNSSFTISGDFEMWCRMNSKGAKFKKLDEFLGVFYQNPNGVSTARDEQRNIKHLQEDNWIRKTYS